MRTPLDYLGEVIHLAILMVDQIEWVDFVNAPDDSFTKGATDFVRRPESRDGIKRVVEGMGKGIAGSPLALKMMDPEELVAACVLLTTAIKSFIKVTVPSQASVMNARLCFKLSFKSATALSRWAS